jgi:SAM-dependent methyltransferase
VDQALRDSLADVEDRHWWFEGRRMILRRLLETQGARGPVLEVGCGNGANLEMLREFGQITAVEPDDADRARAAARQIGVVLPGSLPDGLGIDTSFGTVLALDVIEHVEDDLASVMAMRDQLAPGGHLVLTVPAYPWLWSEHDRVNGHYRRYTRRTLATLLGRADLQIDRLSYFNSFLLGPIAAVRVLGRLFGQDGAGTGLPPGWLNLSLLKLLGFESRLLGRSNLPVGVSLVAIARHTSRSPLDASLPSR